MAMAALRKEVQLEVSKHKFDEQARTLMEVNYVYNEHATYRRDLVDTFPDEPAVPPAFEACARFVAVDADTKDV